MPVATIKIPSAGTVWLRLFATAVALVIAVSAVIASTTAVEGRNWTREIAATRASQITYERAMRAADRQLKLLVRAKAQTKRKLKKARRNLLRVQARRSELEQRYRSSRSEFEFARTVLAVSETARGAGG